MDMKEIKETVARISGRRNQACYTVLCYAAEAACRCQPQEPQMKTILRDAAARMGTAETPATLSKALSRVMRDIWDHGDRRELEKLFGGPLVEQPTPRALVLRLAEAAWQKRLSPGREIRYRLWRSLTDESYGVAVDIEEPEYHAVTSTFCRDLETAEALVQRLNRDQVPLETFEARYLDGDLLALLSK